MSNEALDLWQQFMERLDNDPWLCGVDGTMFCLFCEGEYPEHEDGCIFLAVEDMLTRTTMTVPARFEE